MKKIIALLLGIAMIAICSGCTPDDPLVTTTAQSANGSVCYQTDPATAQAWTKLANAYTQQTGITVTVVTDDQSAPTVFSFSDPAELHPQALDLSDTPLVGQLTCQDLGLHDKNGKLIAIAYQYRSFGVIVNTALLSAAEQEAGQITNFAALKKVVEDIHSRCEKLGFDAFSAAGLEDAATYLANTPLYYEIRDNGNAQTITGTYLGNLRRIWDLCAQNAAPGDDAKAEFLAGKTAFWLAGDWEYDDIARAGISDVAMIPLYCGIEGESLAGLCAQPECFWAVNAQAAPEDIAASLDFLYWVVTSSEGTEFLAQHYGAAPFQNAAFTQNSLQNDAVRLQKSGNYTITLAYTHAAEPSRWLNPLMQALAAYAAEPNDSNWNKVSRAFTDNWVN